MDGQAVWQTERHAPRLNPYELLGPTRTRTHIPENKTQPLSWTRFAPAALTLAALGLALVPPSGTNSFVEAPRPGSPSPAPTTSPESHPAPSYPLSGRVVRLAPGGMVVDSAGRQFEVSFRTIFDVWRETSVDASALEVGDDVFINGGHVTANIGRVDGVIREIDETGMLIDVRGPYGPRGLKRIDFSPYIEYGYVGGPKLTRADLVVGREIGTVIYGRPGGPLRATRIW